jgi:phosphatidate cytidylyltransferase
MKTRIISIAFLLPLVITAIIIGNWLYYAVIAIVTLLASFEYVEMLRRQGYNLALPLILALVLLWLADAVWSGSQWLSPGLAGLTLLASGWILYRRIKNPEERTPTAEWALTLAGGIYLGIGGAYLIQMRTLPDGLWWTLTALPIVWVGESAAYLLGRRYGQHKMAPTISPGKSWEGYAGELGSGVLTGLFLGWLWPTVAQTTIGLTMGKGLLLGIVIAAMTTAGDFFVSMIKREVGVKDTGKLIPGHGGFFDRIDSLLWTGIITWAFVTLFA